MEEKRREEKEKLMKEVRELKQRDRRGKWWAGRNRKKRINEDISMEK